MIFAEFLLAEDGEFQRHLLTACGHLIVMALEEMRIIAAR
jgi:hypothetical protein